MTIDYLMLAPVPNGTWEELVKKIQTSAKAYRGPSSKYVRPPKFSDREIGRHVRRAAQIMEERGWTAGALENEQGNVCAMGAMGRACSPMKPVMRRHLECAFNARFGVWMSENHPHPAGFCGVVTWNDTILKEDTLQWLRKFADAMDPQR